MDQPGNVVSKIHRRTLNIKNSLPDTLFLVVNSQCNLRCRMCDVGQSSKEGQFYKVMTRGKSILSQDTIYALLKDTASWRPKIAITGTEPLLYPYIREVTRRILESGHDLQITTNGFLLEEFADFFVEVGLTELWVSLDGPPSVHDYIRGVQGSFEKAERGIRRIHDNAAFAEGGKPRISLNCTLSNYNQHCLVAFLETIRELELHPDLVTFCHTNFVTDEMAGSHNARWGAKYSANASCTSEFDPKKVSPDVLWGQIEALRNWKDIKISFSPNLLSKEDVATYYHKPKRFVTSKFCNMAHHSAQILSDGTLTVSTRCMDISLGNVNETHFMDLWKGGKRAAFLSDLEKAGAFSVCSRCCGVF